MSHSELVELFLKSTGNKNIPHLTGFTIERSRILRESSLQQVVSSHSQKILSFSIFWLWLPVGDHRKRLLNRFETEYVRGSRHRNSQMKITKIYTDGIGDTVSVYLVEEKKRRMYIADRCVGIHRISLKVIKLDDLEKRLESPEELVSFAKDALKGKVKQRKLRPMI